MTAADMRAELAVYLNDHLAGSVAGVDLARRLSLRPGADPRLPELADAIVADQQALREVLRRLAAPESPLKQGTAWLAEKLTRLKTARGSTGAAPRDLLTELELLALGVHGKRLLWEVLRTVQALFPELACQDFAALADRAAAQHAFLNEQRLAAARAAFGSTAAPGRNSVARAR